MVSRASSCALRAIGRSMSLPDEAQASEVNQFVHQRLRAIRAVEEGVEPGFDHVALRRLEGIGDAGHDVLTGDALHIDVEDRRHLQGAKIRLPARRSSRWPGATTSPARTIPGCASFTLIWAIAHSRGRSDSCAANRPWPSIGQSRERLERLLDGERAAPDNAGEEDS